MLFRSDGVHIGKVLLADVNAVGSGQSRDVSAIVDDECRPGLARDRGDGRSFGEKACARHRPAAKLQEGGAAVEKCAREIERLPAGALGRFDIDDGVQLL